MHMYRKIESELSLELSLGRYFAVETSETQLVGTSNAAMSTFPNGSEIPSASAPLGRTSSLPPERGEWSRKRREHQGLERVGVKRKQAEKNSCSRSGVPEVESSRSAELRRTSSDLGRSMEGLSNSTSAASLPGNGHQSVVAVDPLPPRLRSLKSLQRALKRAAGNLNRQKEMGRNLIDEMPCVSVRGCRRIEGFLYKYRRGEEAGIVCVCHGNFFTPAEFVKHAGGGDVDNPLKHIVVNPSPSVYY
ncbi:Ninja-family protein 1 [Platanthera guangdongensis]|uniref:Ninja-family protein n=1 Tax=Platanthera guangdongensis TaxID=2320717 RepID=A0ABR2LXS9_9ASPA